MIKIAHVREVTGLRFPQEVVDVVIATVATLDVAYGEERDVDSGDGGYVLIIEANDELERLKDIHIDVKTVITEYTDIIQCANGLIFTSTLILLSDDFGVVIIMPIELLKFTRW